MKVSANILRLIGLAVLIQACAANYDDVILDRPDLARLSQIRMETRRMDQARRCGVYETELRDILSEKFGPNASRQELFSAIIEILSHRKLPFDNGQPVLTDLSSCLENPVHESMSDEIKREVIASPPLSRQESMSDSSNPMKEAIEEFENVKNNVKDFGKDLYHHAVDSNDHGSSIHVDSHHDVTNLPNEHHSEHLEHVSEHLNNNLGEHHDQHVESLHDIVNSPGEHHSEHVEHASQHLNNNLGDHQHDEHLEHHAVDQTHHEIAPGHHESGYTERHSESSHSSEHTSNGGLSGFVNNLDDRLENRFDMEDDDYPHHTHELHDHGEHHDDSFVEKIQDKIEEHLVDHHDAPHGQHLDNVLHDQSHYDVGVHGGQIDVHHVDVDNGHVDVHHVDDGLHHIPETYVDNHHIPDSHIDSHHIPETHVDSYHIPNGHVDTFHEHVEHDNGGHSHGIEEVVQNQVTPDGRKSSYVSVNEYSQEHQHSNTGPISPSRLTEDHFSAPAAKEAEHVALEHELMAKQQEINNLLNKVAELQGLVDKLTRTNISPASTAVSLDQARLDTMRQQYEQAARREENTARSLAAAQAELAEKDGLIKMLIEKDRKREHEHKYVSKDDDDDDDDDDRHQNYGDSDDDDDEEEEDVDLQRLVEVADKLQDKMSSYEDFPTRCYKYYLLFEANQSINKDIAKKIGKMRINGPIPRYQISNLNVMRQISDLLVRSGQKRAVRAGTDMRLCFLQQANTWLPTSSATRFGGRLGPLPPIPPIPPMPPMRFY